MLRGPPENAKQLPFFHQQHATGPKKMLKKITTKAKKEFREEGKEKAKEGTPPPRRGTAARKTSGVTAAAAGLSEKMAPSAFLGASAAAVGPSQQSGAHTSV